MTQALWIAKTGLDAQQTRMAVVSNNLANVNTTGFKQGRAMFEDLLYQNVRQPGGSTTQDATLPSGVTLGTGVRVVSTEKMFTQGSVVNTDRDLDVMINGRGFFEITRPDGTSGFTRDGSFQLDAQGQMVTSSGYALADGITIPADAQSVTIGVDGTVTVRLPGQATPSQVGTIQLSTFPNPGGLQPIGENLFVETASSGSASAGTAGESGFGSLQQGSLEGSNVNVVSELVSMIETQRAYEMNSKAISTTDQMMQYVNNNL